MADLDLARVKRNVAKMAAMGAPEADIDGYIASEGTTVEAVRAFRPGASSSPASSAPSPAPVDATGQRYSATGIPLGDDVTQVQPGANRSGLAPAGAPEGGRYGGAAMNATAGINEAMYGIVGLPVDAARGVINLGIGGYNAATGSDVQPIPENSFGGSRSVAEALGAVAPQLDPQNTIATSATDRIARGTGQGVGGTVLPAGIVSGLSRAGALSPSMATMGELLFGRAGSGREMALGAAGGAGATGAQELTSDRYDPLSSLAGGIANATALGGIMAAGRGAANLVRPFTEGGRERMAGERLIAGARDPETFRRSLDNQPAPLVPGSQPTTGQVTGDLGILGMERGAVTREPEAFAQRRGEQNEARINLMRGIEAAGAPDRVAGALRQRLEAIETEGRRQLDDATAAARSSAGAIGAAATPDAAGTEIRTAIENRRAVAKTQERALWRAVDPDGTLVAPVEQSKRAAAEILSGLPASARRPEGEEAAILDVMRGYGDSVPFAEMGAMRSRLNDALRSERQANGESQTYARLSMLRGALENDLSAGVMAQSARDNAAVSAGALSPEQTIGARIANAPTTGNTVFTPSGREIPVQYEVVDASTLRASNTADGRPNPDYPAELQPRDRTRAASDAQIAGMARNLQPERLGPSAEAATGAPIVGPDGIVESGNGRVLAIRRAYGEGGNSAQAYRRYLEGQGYSLDGIREPVLIRRRSGDMSMQDRARFAQEGNANASLSMSAGEQAATDASRLSAEVLRLYRGGDPASAENRDFARAFLLSVADRGQEGSFATGSGNLSIDGGQRMRKALLHSAYQDGRLVSALVDEGDENIRAFGRALDDVAGDVARLNARISSGEVVNTANLAAPLVEAAKIVQSARARGINLADALAQQDAFTRPSRATLQVLASAYGPNLTGRLSRERLVGMMRDAVAEAEQQTAGARLFGEPLSIETILEGVQRRYADGGGGRGSTGTPGQGSDALRPAGGGSSGVPAGAGVPSAGAGASGIGGILPGQAPNFDDAARQRLAAASTATRERAATFDNRTLAPIRRRPSTTSAYDMPAGLVPQRFFKSGSGSFEAIGQLRQAIGPQAANQALEGYAVGQALKAAAREDGTLDPARLESFRRSHADALRALPDLDRRLADAGRASQAVAEVTAARRDVTAQAQKDRLGRLLKVDTPEDVTGIVGGIFSAQDATRQMASLRAAIGNDAEARKGLRRAIADHMANRFIGNVEVATTGQGGVKSDAFQNFTRQHETTLRAAGFTEQELGTLRAIAEDLQRAGRSVSAVKNPGGSDTAQNLYRLGKDGTPFGAIMRQAFATGGAGLGVGLLSSGVTGVVTAGGVGAFAFLRNAGLRGVDDLITDALLNPERARLLLSKVPAGGEESRWKALQRTYGRAAAQTLANEPETSQDDEIGRLLLDGGSLPPERRADAGSSGLVAAALMRGMGGQQQATPDRRIVEALAA